MATTNGPTGATNPLGTSDGTPIAIDRVALTVRDLDRVGDFYKSAIGLDRIAADGETMTLGTGARALLELRRDSKARSLSREAGLFHTAFLYPERADLGRWLVHAVHRGLRLDGGSDHLVSEAVYLRDPEGNGIELYTDRPRSAWQTDGIRVAMDTLPLDMESLVRAPGSWIGAPEGTVIGHVHLQVGDVGEAEAFYRDELGFDVSASLPGARFFATGGYHHHLAGNAWNSRGAGMRSADAAGLAEISLSASPERATGLGAGALVDPWGNRFAVRTRTATAALAA